MGEPALLTHAPRTRNSTPLEELCELVKQLEVILVPETHPTSHNNLSLLEVLLRVEALADTLYSLYPRMLFGESWLEAFNDTTPIIVGGKRLKGPRPNSGHLRPVLGCKHNGELFSSEVGSYLFELTILINLKLDTVSRKPSVHPASNT